MRRDREAEGAAARLPADQRVLFETACRSGRSPAEALSFAQGRPEPFEPNLTQALVGAVGAGESSRPRLTFRQSEELRERSRARSVSPEAPPPGPASRPGLSEATSGDEGASAEELDELARLRRINVEFAVAKGVPLEEARRTAGRVWTLEALRRRSTSTGTRLRESAAPRSRQTDRSWRLARFDEAQNRRLHELIDQGLSIAEAIRRVEGGQS